MDAETILFVVSDDSQRSGALKPLDLCVWTLACAGTTVFALSGSSPFTTTSMTRICNVWGLTGAENTVFVEREQTGPLVTPGTVLGAKLL